MSRLSKKNKKLTKNHGLQLEEIYPSTLNQERTFEAYENGDNLMLHGVAGTGKTFISLYLALRDVLEGDQYKNVKIIRSAVPTRDIGFLPGKEEDKTAIYEQPYKAICTELFNRSDAYSILKHHFLIDFTSTSFVRGMTFRDSIIIVDECSNMNFHELDSVITRLGDNCRVIFCGDFRQSDLLREAEKKGIHNFMSILSNIEFFSHIEFEIEDIVRSGIVKEYITEKSRLGFST